MWEIFSYGKTPYSACNNQETIDQVNGGYRLPIPRKCPQSAYALMLQCWDMEPAKRPNFRDLYNRILPMLGNTEEPVVVKPKNNNLEALYN